MATVTLQDLRKAINQIHDVRLPGGTRPEELERDLLAVKNALSDLRTVVDKTITYLEGEVKQ